MKKVLKVLSAAMLSAVVAVGASASVFAASTTGLNAAEEKVLAELHTTVEMGGIQKSLPVQYINGQGLPHKRWQEQVLRLH